MSEQIKIGGRLHSIAEGNVATGANEILDDTKGKKQNVINQETDAELERLENAKQDNLTFDTTPTEGSTNPITSGGVFAADAEIQQAIEAILLLIPSAASALNQLADKAFVNSTVATNTATFRGTYNVVTDLELHYDATHQQIATALLSKIQTADNNDYCFVQIPVSDSSGDIRVTERYKFNGTAWGYEYDLNNSGFTAAQWAAINSTITQALVDKLGALPTAAELAIALNGKQNTLTFDGTPTAGSSNPVTSAGLYAAFAAINATIPAGASADNKLVAETRLAEYVAAIINALDATYNVTSTDGHVNVRLTQVDGAITSVEVLTNDIASAEALNTLTGRMSTAESDIDALQDAYAALTQSDVVIVNGALPSSGQQQNIIYRQPDKDHTPPQFYSDYMWNGTTWVLMATYNNAIDPRPKKGSQNLVTSGGVFDNMGALDVSELNATENPHTLATYADLSAALAAIPSDYQKGGMSVKFVCSSDNKYIQYRFLLSGSFTDAQFVNIANWQIMDGGTSVKSLLGYKIGYSKKNCTANKTINGSGVESTKTGIMLSKDLIPVTGGSTIVWKCGIANNQWDGVLIEYDSSDGILRYYTMNAKQRTIVLDENTVKVRACFVVDNVDAGIYQQDETPIFIAMPEDGLYEFSNTLFVQAYILNNDVPTFAFSNEELTITLPGSDVRLLHKDGTTSNIYAPPEGERTFVLAKGKKLVVNLETSAYSVLDYYAEALNTAALVIYRGNNVVDGLLIGYYLAAIDTKFSNNVSTLANTVNTNQIENNIQIDSFKGTIGKGTTNVIKNKTINSTTGDIVALSGYCITADYVNVTGGEKIIWYNGRTNQSAANGILIEYDSNDNPIGYSSFNNTVNLRKEVTLNNNTVKVKAPFIMGVPNTGIYDKNGKAIFVVLENDGLSKKFDVEDIRLGYSYFAANANPTFSKTSDGLTVTLPTTVMRIYTQDGIANQYNAPSDRTFTLQNFKSLVLDTINGTYSVIDFNTATEHSVVLLSYRGNVAISGLLKPYYDAWITNRIPYGGEDIIQRYSAKDKITIKNNVIKNSAFKAIFFSDIHGNSTEFQRIVSLANSWDNNVDCIIDTGDDTGTYQDATPISGWFDDIAATANKPIVRAAGNHDAWTTGPWQWATDEELYNYFTKDAVTLLRAKGATVVQPDDAATLYKNYYYADFGSIRVIVLMSLTSGSSNHYYDSAQNTWLRSVLTDSITNSKHVICMNHGPLDPAACDEIESRWTSWYSWKTIAQDTQHLDNSAVAEIDSFISNGGTFICYLAGHSHADYLLKPTGVTNVQLCFVTSCAKNGVIDGTQPNTIDDEGYDLFNYLGIDTTHKLMKVWRIGFDINAALQKHDFFCWDYGNKKLINND